MAAPTSEVSRGSDAPSGGSLLSLQYSKVEKPEEEDEMKVVMAMQLLHAQICPAVVQAAAALAAVCMQAIKPGTASGECTHCTLRICPAPTKCLVSAQTVLFASVSAQTVPFACVMHKQGVW